MLKLKVNQILIEQDKSMYWLSKQTGIAANHIGRICNEETGTIRFDTLEKICIALNCSINDLFESTDPKMSSLLKSNE